MQLRVASTDGLGPTAVRGKRREANSRFKHEPADNEADGRDHAANGDQGFGER